MSIVATLRRIRVDHGVSTQRVTMAWQLSLGEHVIPIVASTQPATARGSAAATDVILSTDEISAMQQTVGWGIQ
jgi:diketogulonate reductase-like aldo/keto reductase